MKRILSVLGLAILVGLASLVPLPAKAQTEGMANFVHRDSTGLAPFRIGRMWGKKSDFSQTGTALNNTTTTTYDILKFGFTADYVRLCIAGASNPVYIRRGTATSNLAERLNTSATSDRMIVPIGSPSDFISGDATWERAVPLTSRQTTTGVIGAGTMAATDGCIGLPLATPGLVIHVQTGLATVDVQAFQAAR